MEPSLPVLVVGPDAPSPALLDELRAGGLDPRPCTPDEVLGLLGAGVAEAVLARPVPFWRLLLSRVVTSGATALLHVGEGPAPRALPGGVVAVSRADEVAPVLREARARRGADTAPAQVAPTLEQRLSEAERFSSEVQALHLSSTPEKIAWEAVRRVRGLLQADRVLCWRIGEEATLTLGAADPALPVPPASMPIGELLAGACAAEAAQLCRAEDELPGPWREAARRRDGAEPGAMLAVPLVRAGELVGVLEAVRRPGRSPFTDPDRQRFAAWGSQVATALAGALNTARLHAAQSEIVAANAALEAKIELRTRAVVHAKREWERTFDAIREPIVLQDRFVIRRANLAYAEAAGVPITQVPGKTCHQLLAGRVAPCVGCPLATGAPDLAAEISLPRGRTVRFSGFRTGAAGDPDLVVIHYRDVTAQRALEARLREQERLASLGQLAQGAAHEIQTPLGAVLGNLSTLRGAADELESGADSIERAARLCGQGDAAAAVRALTEVQVRDLAVSLRELLQDMEDGARRIGAIVKGLRELARQDVARPAPVDPNDCVLRALRAELGDAASSVALRSESTAKVLVTPGQLEQALVQLVRNARLAAPSGTLGVRTRDEQGAVVIEVQDEGPGIPGAHLSRIFEPFFTTRGGTQGIGLGLTLVWSIVQRAGGTLEVSSEPGLGSTFRIRLPTLAAAATPEGPGNVAA
ncbi:MAG TPA: ATP-binding protein [Myxococcaceae bacterium]|nr:ATP-binding protein [Myxococcaceae bacterium]